METSHLNKLSTEGVQLYILTSNVLPTLCHLNHPKLLLQAHIKNTQKKTTIKAILAVVKQQL